MRRIVLLLAVLAVAAWSSAAQASTFTTSPALGQAAGFNVFTFGDLNVFNSDIQGSVAVGGNATLSNYAVASQQAGGSLYAGGNVSWNSGSVGQGSGNIVYGGTLAGNSTYASATQNSAAVDFAATEALVKANSAYWGGLDGSTVSNQYTTLTLNADQSGLNVFYVDGQELKNVVSNLVINAVADATVLINVAGGADGQAVGYDFSGYQLSGQSSSHVLFNFYEASDVVIFNGVGVQASVVAPNANVDFTNGQIIGQIIAQSLTGNGEVHLPLFEGSPPLPAAVPAPAAAWLLGSGVLGLVGLRRRG